MKLFKKFFIKSDDTIIEDQIFQHIINREDINDAVKILKIDERIKLTIIPYFVDNTEFAKCYIKYVLRGKIYNLFYLVNDEIRVVIDWSNIDEIRSIIQQKNIDKRLNKIKYILNETI